MSEKRNSRLSPRDLWLVALGACSLWLVLQNTMLALGLLWARPSGALTVTATLTKIAALMIEGFWKSPAAAWFVAVLLAVTLGAVVPFVRREVIRNG